MWTVYYVIHIYADSNSSANLLHPCLIHKFHSFLPLLAESFPGLIFPHTCTQNMLLNDYVPANTLNPQRSALLMFHLLVQKNQGGWFITCHLSSATCQPVKKDGVTASQWRDEKSLSFCIALTKLYLRSRNTTNLLVPFRLVILLLAAVTAECLFVLFSFLPSKVAACATTQLLSTSAEGTLISPLLEIVA